MMMIVVGGGPVLWCAVILSGVGILDNSLDRLFPRELEEPGLEKRFGASYLNHKRAVGRWMPRIGKSKFEE
jgi:protein-S-isoprenylcysteine O-methyltransferase Ste14